MNCRFVDDVRFPVVSGTVERRPNKWPVVFSKKVASGKVMISLCSLSWQAYWYSVLQDFQKMAGVVYSQCSNLIIMYCMECNQFRPLRSVTGEHYELVVAVRRWEDLFQLLVKICNFLSCISFTLITWMANLPVLCKQDFYDILRYWHIINNGIVLVKSISLLVKPILMSGESLINFSFLFSVY